MSYITEEKGGADPVELYEFIFGDQTWRFTDGDAPYTHPDTSDEYTPEMISRGNIQQSEEDTSMNVDVTVDALNPVADFFRTPFLPSRHIWLTIYRTHRGSVSSPGILFRGLVGTAEFENNTCKLTCISQKHAIGKRVPVQLVQKLCTNTLYDQRCKADPELFKITGTIVDIDGLTLTMDYVGTGHAVGYFDGGYIEKAGIPPATIRTDNAPTLLLMYNPGYVIGDLIEIFAGCDKRVLTCETKFNNVPNFQGFPFMPVKDPFAGEVM